MKQRTKKVLLFSASLAVLGVLLCAVSLSITGFDFTRLSVPSNSDRTELVQTYEPAEVTRIVVDTEIDGVTLQPSPDGQLQLRCYPGGGYTYDAAVNGTELNIQQRKSGAARLPSWFQINFDWDRGRTLTLSIPKGYDGDLLLEVDCGSLEIADGLDFTGALDAKLALGNFSSGNLTAQSVTAQCSAGDITGLGWQIGQYARLAAGTGNVSIEDSAIGDMLSCETGLGDIFLSQTTVPETTLYTGAGDVGFHGLTASHIQAASGLGDVEGSIYGAEEDYSVDLGTKLGESNLPTRRGLTDKTLRIDCGAGDIRVKFLPERR